MIDEMEILAAADSHVGHAAEIDEGCDVALRREAFKAGVRWGVERFRQSLWHDAGERPQAGRPIIVKPEPRTTEVFVIDLKRYNYILNEWEELRRLSSMLEWAYIDDIRPE